MRKLRVLQTPVRFYPFVGGVENYVHELSKRLGTFGHEVIVLCSMEGSNRDYEEYNGKISVRRLRYLFKIANTNVTPSLPLHLVKEEFDVVHTHLPTPWSSDWSAFIAKTKKKPLILTYHNDITATGIWIPFSWSYNRFLLNKLLNAASKILVSQQRYLNSPYLSGFREKIRVLPPGVDVCKFRPLNLGKSDRTLLFVGILDRYHDYKGLDILFKAIKILKDEKQRLRLQVVGTGELEVWYRRLADELNLKDCVEFQGRVDEEKLVELYNRCSCLVLPSKSAVQEGFGMVALEALSCGTPVIASRVAGISEDLEKNRCGIVVEPDKQELAGAICELMSLNGNAMGKRGRRLVLRKYSWDVVAKKVEKIYYEALEEEK